VTGCEVARAEGREKASLNVLSWDVRRIQSLVAGGDLHLSGLESIHRDGCDLLAEATFLEPVASSTITDRQTLKSCKKEIQKTIKRIEAEIKKAKKAQRQVNVPRRKRMSTALNPEKPSKRSKANPQDASRGRRTGAN